MTVSRRSMISLTMGGAALLSGCSTSSDGVRNNANVTTQPRSRPQQRQAVPLNYFDTTPAPFPQFSAILDEPTYGFNFDSWNKLISTYVIDFGPSDRVSRQKPAPAMGTRFIKGHESPYRAEGNRIPFSAFQEEDQRRFVQARQVLEELGNRESISKFSWGEQLAFWFNLHNAALIEQLALAYPVQRPSRMRIGPDNLPLHDAKLVTVQGAQLSLRDIRIEIVYRYWRHPAVIYGFFHGDVGGPSIRKGAFSGPRVQRQLADNAVEFVNSLRGVRSDRKHISVSKLYEEALPIFSDWQGELRNHLGDYAGEQVGELLQSGLPLRIKQYDNRIADLAGGETSGGSVSPAADSALFPDSGTPELPPDASFTLGSQMINNVRNSTVSLPGLPDHANRLMRERAYKMQNLRSRLRGLRRGAVTIEDLPTRPVD